MFVIDDYVNDYFDFKPCTKEWVNKCCDYNKRHSNKYGMQFKYEKEKYFFRLFNPETNDELISNISKLG